MTSSRQRIATLMASTIASTLFAGAAVAMDVKVALNYPTSDPSYAGMEHFETKLEEISGGEMDVQIFPAGQIGDNKSQLQALQINAFEVNVQGLTQYPAYDGLNIPYFWKSNDHFLKVINGPLFEDTRQQIIKDRSTRMMGIANRGYRNVLSREKPLDSIEDFEGLKIRAPMSPPFVKSFEALGARPTPIEWSETYNAMLLGTIDAMENALGLIYNTKFYEVGDQLTLTKHLVAPAFFMVSEQWYSGLSEEQRGWVDTAMQEAVALTQSAYEEEDFSFREKLEAEGVTFHEPDLAPFAKATEEAAREIGVGAWGEDLYEKALKTAAEY